MFMIHVEFAGFKETLRIDNDKIGKAINKLNPEDKLEIISYVDFDTDKIEDLRLLFKQSLNFLLEHDLTAPEISILHSTLKQSLIKFEEKYKELDKL